MRVVAAGDLTYEVMTSWYTATKQTKNKLLTPVYWSSEAIHTLFQYIKCSEKSQKKDKTTNVRLTNKK